VIEETIPLPSGEIVLERPGNADELLDEAEFEARDEYVPYWAELWPAGVALARALDGCSLGGRRVVELGCGLGLVALVAARAGAQVLATDWAPEALEYVERNAERNDVSVDTATVDWRTPDALVDAAPWDLVVASDVTYEARNLSPILELLPRLSKEAWVADPGRATSPEFLDRADAIGERRTTFDTHHPHVSVHRFRWK
jgi:predicted nicotinamide N-methyase